PDDVEAVVRPVLGWGGVDLAQVLAELVEGLVVPGDERDAGPGADLLREVGLVTGGVAFDDLQPESGSQRADGLHRALAVAPCVRGGVNGVRPSQPDGWITAGRGEQL